MSQVVVTARIDAETAAKLNRLGAEYDRKRSWLIAQAIKRYADDSCAYLDFIDEGERSGEEEGWIPQEQVMAELKALIDTHKSAA